MGLLSKSDSSGEKKALKTNKVAPNPNEQQESGGDGLLANMTNAKDQVMGKIDDIKSLGKDMKGEMSKMAKSEEYGTFREGLLYVLFLTTFLIVTLMGMKGGEDTYYYTNRMKEFFTGAEFRPSDVPNYDKTFADILTPEDAWYFMEGPLHAALFQDTWYNGDKYAEEERGMILLHNRLLGGARIRTMRVQPDTCKVRAEYQSIIKYCYDKLTWSNEDKSGFGPVLNAPEIASGAAYSTALMLYRQNQTTAAVFCLPSCKRNCESKFGEDSYKYVAQCEAQCKQYCACGTSIVTNETACPDPLGGAGTPPRNFKYTWKSRRELQEVPYYGWLAVYLGSGYVQDLPINSTEAMDILLQMKQNQFIDLGTRAIFIDFTVYNSYLSLYNVIRFSLEFPATGGVIPRSRFQVVALEKYSNGPDFVMIMELILVAFVLFYFGQEMMEIASEGLSYFKTIWNFLDIVNLIIFLIVICLRLYTTDMIYGILGVTTRLPELRATTFPNLQSVAFLLTTETNLNAINAFIMWFKFFKYCQVSKKMSFLLRIMARASTDIFYFLIIFLIFFLGFAQAGYLAFSVDVVDFRTFEYSLLTLFRAIVGELDYDALFKAHRVFGPLYYILFYIIVLLVLLNVFLAILNDAYTEVRTEDQESGVYDEPGVLSGGMGAIMNALRGKPMTKNSITHALEQAAADGEFDLSDLEEILSKSTVKNPAEVAKSLMAEFDDDDDGRLSKNEMETLKRRIKSIEEKEKEEERLKKEQLVGKTPATETDTHLLQGFTQLETQMQQLLQLNDSRQNQMMRIESVLSSLEQR